MCHLLWAQGNAEAAIQVEKLGNHLAKTYDIDILCGYSLGGVPGGMDSQIFQRICDTFSRSFPGKNALKVYAAGDRVPPMQVEDATLPPRHAASAAPSTSRRKSVSGIANSVKPQFIQTRSFGKTHTMGLFRPFSPGKWIATSAVRLLWCSDWQDLQDIAPYLGKTRCTKGSRAAYQCTDCPDLPCRIHEAVDR